MEQANMALKDSGGTPDGFRGHSTSTHISGVENAARLAADRLPGQKMSGLFGNTRNRDLGFVSSSTGPGVATVSAGDKPEPFRNLTTSGNISAVSCPLTTFSNSTTDHEPKPSPSGNICFGSRPAFCKIDGSGTSSRSNWGGVSPHSRSLSSAPNGTARKVGKPATSVKAGSLSFGNVLPFGETENSRTASSSISGALAVKNNVFGKPATTIDRKSDGGAGFARNSDVSSFQLKTERKDKNPSGSSFGNTQSAEGGDFPSSSLFSPNSLSKTLVAKDKDDTPATSSKAESTSVFQFENTRIRENKDFVGQSFSFPLVIEKKNDKAASLERTQSTGVAPSILFQAPVATEKLDKLWAIGKGNKGAPIFLFGSAPMDEEPMPAKDGGSQVMAGRGEGQGPAIGIDLGTTYSVVAVCGKNGKVGVPANNNGSRTTPSVVGILEDESFVGEAAKDLPPEMQVFDAKRLIGRPWNDENIQTDRKLWPFEVVEEMGTPRIKIKINGKDEKFAPEEISAMVVKDLKKTAEDFLREPVDRAVVTVPAYFNERQRQATMHACQIAGLKVLAIINEPTAAAIAYGLDKKSPTKKTVLVYDLGGGTFDVSVVEINGNEVRVLASDGDTHLGGQDFDSRLLLHCSKEILKTHGVSLEDDQMALQETLKACELAKRKLSNVPTTAIPVCLTRAKVATRVTVSRACFESLCADLFKKTATVTTQVLAAAMVPYSAVDEVVLVGGSTRIPKVRTMLSDLFGDKLLRNAINPDEAVAHGAAVYAASLSGDGAMKNLVVLKDVTPLSLGVEVIGGRFSVIIPRNSPLPCKKTERYLTTKDFQKFHRLKGWETP